jgi:hypothetical protein
MVRTSRARKKQHMGRKPPEAEGKDLGNLWILEEIDHCWQEDDPPCKSGMAQEKCFQEKSDQGPGGMRSSERTGRDVGGAWNAKLE